ncbi:LSU ribosomal protein L7AE [Melghirimyces profundicolus]|uniref:LSU ribosomal protein L7AE n=1 Tax=Melghirimyces profundicolus TaxID=1242148 RepID=A0A2T6BRF4_9BACL|nr:YlxQ family RNA-binding protein [Melghirimyces profundicolus]PTX58622.1 LSU ribosomal protein L7AE [Melghirimyces profundicolus]
MDKVHQMLGMAMRAGKVVSGEEQVVSAIRSGAASLVFLSDDAASNARKKITDKCTHYRVPLVTVGSREALGRAIGKPERVTVAVTDPGFADAMRKWCE